MSSSEEEVRATLEGKRLKNIILPDNSNEIDRGSNSPKEVKIGEKSSEISKEKLSWYNYVTERNKKLQFGDRQAVAEYMQEAAEIRKKLEDQKFQSRLEHDFRQEEQSTLARESRITQADRDEEAQDIQKLERKRDKEIANIYEYFNCPEEEWQEYLHDHHTAEESPANVLIGTGTVGFVCKLHRYRDGACSDFTISPIEDHFRKYDPEVHKAAIIDSINEKYDKLIQERKEQTFEDPDIKLKKEIRDIEKIKTRPDGDYGVLNSGTKLTKADRARIRREEEAQNEENRRIYRGLY